jgi:hypothetical protein
MNDHAILFWTFIITLIGVVAGVVVLFATFLTIRDSRRATKAQFWFMLRGIFARYDDIHANFRPGVDWHGSSVLPATGEDMGRTEVYLSASLSIATGFSRNDSSILGILWFVPLSSNQYCSESTGDRSKTCRPSDQLDGVHKPVLSSRRTDASGRTPADSRRTFEALSKRERDHIGANPPHHQASFAKR